MPDLSVYLDSHGTRRGVTSDMAEPAPKADAHASIIAAGAAAGMGGMAHGIIAAYDYAGSGAADAVDGPPVAGRGGSASRAHAFSAHSFPAGAGSLGRDAGASSARGPF